MKTLYLEITDADEELIITKAADIILKGGIVAFPTETVYGLGANAFDGKAVKKIFEAKKRPMDNPLIVHVSDMEMLKSVADISNDKVKQLIRHFWPGPLSLILPKKSSIPKEVSAGLDTVAVRMPNHPIALKLIKKASVPIAAPSANLSGRPSPTTAQHVLDDLDGVIDAVIDAGAAQVGVESTVVDISKDIPVVLRAGAVSAEDIKRAAQVEVVYNLEAKGKETPKSPGMKYRHYAPKAKMVLIEGNLESIRKKILDKIEFYLKQGEKVGVFCCVKNAPYYSRAFVEKYGNPETAAAILYKALRRFDEIGVDVILAEALEEKGIGAAVMDRLRRAADQRL
ncbi:L-threonylcarbamoyladenylate synthase [Peptococcaceae bacterium]|nr:L-threonylcarbamoyladenylate synthase [Peptococcaceae bacterium]